MTTLPVSHFYGLFGVRRRQSVRRGRRLATRVGVLERGFATVGAVFFRGLDMPRKLAGTDKSVRARLFSGPVPVCEQSRRFEERGGRLARRCDATGNRGSAAEVSGLTFLLCFSATVLGGLLIAWRAVRFAVRLRPWREAPKELRKEVQKKFQIERSLATAIGGREFVSAVRGPWLRRWNELGVFDGGTLAHFRWVVFFSFLPKFVLTVLLLFNLRITMP